MKSIPGHILGVEILRPETRSRLDGSVVTEFLRESPGAISYGWTKEELVSAESAFTAQPRFTRRAPQETIVSCRIGEVFIATIDLRIDSPTFCDWQGFYLQEGDERTLFVPPGVAVGWQVCSSDAQVYFRYAIDPHSCDWAWMEYDEPEFEIEWPAYPSVVAEQSLPSCEFAQLLDDDLPSLAEFAKAFESSLGPFTTLPQNVGNRSKT